MKTKRSSKSLASWQTSQLLRGLAAASLLGPVMVACSGDDSSATPVSGAGAGDAATVTDGAAPVGDAAPGTDATTTPDTGTTTNPDAGADGGSDAASDGGNDASTDGGYVPRVLTAVSPLVSPLPSDAGAGARAEVVSLVPGGPDAFYGVVGDTAGNYYAVGRASLGLADDYATVVAKFDGAGALVTGFGTGGVALVNVALGTNGEFFRGIGLQSSGKIVVSGAVEHAGGDPRDRDLAVVRIGTDGKLDESFGTKGIFILDASAGEFVLPVVADAGADAAAPVGRYYADAQWNLAVDANDRVVIDGTRKRSGIAASDYIVARVQAEGKALDTTFATATGNVFSFQLPNDGTGAPVSASARSVTLLADGSILGGGYTSAPILLKLTPAGVLDTTFSAAGSPPGVYNAPIFVGGRTECYSAVPQVAGGVTKFVTTGYGYKVSTDKTRFISLRFGAASVLDTSYGPDGTGASLVDFGGFGDNSRSVQVLKDNRVLLVGGGRGSAANVDGALALLTADGLPDPRLAPSGKVLIDFGGPSDFLWGSAQSPTGTQVAVVGLKGVDTTIVGANDDAAFLLYPITLAP